MRQHELNQVIGDGKTLKLETFKNGRHIRTTVKPRDGQTVESVVAEFSEAFDLNKDSLISFDIGKISL